MKGPFALIKKSDNWKLFMGWLYTYFCKCIISVLIGINYYDAVHNKKELAVAWNSDDPLTMQSHLQCPYCGMYPLSYVVYFGRDDS
jgi:hypothetical protein